MRWISIDELDADRIASCWLISRLVDRSATFGFAPSADLERSARRLKALTFAAPAAEFGPDFAGIVETLRMGAHPALRAMVTAVGRCAGGRDTLASTFAGLATLPLVPLERLRRGVALFDALYVGLAMHEGTAGWLGLQTTDVRLLRPARRAAAGARPPLNRRAPLLAVVGA